MKEKWKYCPICGKNYKEAPAISRKDNTTKICPKCGIEEAIMDFSIYFGGTNTKDLEKIEKDVVEDLKNEVSRIDR